jgi:RNA polymerase sigma-70 factor (ECF subfamily)
MLYLFALCLILSTKRLKLLKSEITSTQSVGSDEDLILRAKIDARAFRPLYEKYYKPIFMFVHHRTGDKELSADLTSQVFLNALVGLEKYEFRGLPFSSWLYRIAINECNSFFRKNKNVRTVLLEDHHAGRVYEEMFGENTAEELKRNLPLMLQKLRPAELQLIELRFLEGRTFREVAEILNISETHAKVKTYRILDKMKKLFVGK